jgi:hypothetical protein
VNEKRIALDAWDRRVAQIIKNKTDGAAVVPFQRGA